MAIVLDASVALAWCFPEEEGASRADAVAMRLISEPGITPRIFWYEIRNVLVRAEWRGRIDREGTMPFLGRLGELQIEIDDGHVEMETLDLAHRHHLTFYDAAYLETAIRRQSSLATLDGELDVAARKKSVGYTYA